MRLVSVLVVASAAQALASQPAHPAARAPLTPQAIDKLLAAEWRRHGVSPSRPADDATFLRRIWLDLAGTIPPPDEVQRFLDDKAGDKRSRAVDRLLASPLYAEHWADYWDAILIGRQVKKAELDRTAFHYWMRDRIAEDTPWDQLVYRLVTAAGVNTPTIAGSPDDAGAAVDGATNWLVHYYPNLPDLAGATAREFLGVQIQCAQCHDHPTEKWKQKDFRKFAAAFSHLRGKPLEGKMKGSPRRFLLDDAPRAQATGPNAPPDRREIAIEKPTALDGTDLDGGNPRERLAKWMTSPANPWLAREMANRMWAYFVGRGFYEPIDDQRPSNPTTLAPLLDALAADFVAHGFDVKHLVRLICQTRAYQLSAGRLARGRDPDGALFARYRLRPMAPEQLFDALAQATELPDAVRALAPDRYDQIREKVKQSVGFLFDVDEEVAQDDFEGTVQQALALLNGSLANAAATAAPQTALGKLLAEKKSDDETIDALYIRTLSRPPRSDEVQRWKEFLAKPREVVDERALGKPKPPPGGRAGKGPPPDVLGGIAQRLRPKEQSARQQAFEDMQWALINTSEFAFRR